MQARIEAEGRRLDEAWRNRKARQESLGFSLAMLSPASAYQLAAMTLAGTEAEMKARYEKAIDDYRTLFNAYVEKRQKASGGMGGNRITFDSNRGFSFSAPRDRGAIDVSDMPRFAPPERNVEPSAPPNMNISTPVHTAVCCSRPTGAPVMPICVQRSLIVS